MNKTESDISEDHGPIEKNDTTALKITLEAKTVFGRQLIYPECEASKTLAQFKGSKTFTKQDVLLLKKMGFQVNFISPNPLD